MKVCLISLNENRGDSYPIGIFSLITYLKKHASFSFEPTFVDANFDLDIYQKVIDSKPEVIGISSMTVEYSQAIKLANKLKKELNVPIILGGVHISTLPVSLKKCFDLGVKGEGEQTFLELIELYNEKGYFKFEDLKNIRGLVLHKDESVFLTEERELLDAEKFGVLDKDLVNPKYFKLRTMQNGKMGICAPLITSRGCPYNCKFCSTKQFWKKFRFHSVDSVVEEIKELYDNYNVTHFNIWDDLFTMNKKRMRDFIEKLQEKGLLKKITFACQARVNLIDDELCQLLKDLNVVHIGFGFESGSDKMLKWLKHDSNLSVEQNRRAAKLCKDYGFLVCGSLIFGSPGETIEDMKASLDLIDYFVKIKVNNIWSFILTPFPATEVWEIAKERGKVDDYDMDWNMLSHQSLDNPLLLDDSIDKEEFKKVFLEGRKKLKYFKWQKIKGDLLRGNIYTMIKNTLKNPKLLTDLISKKHVVSETKL